MAMNANYDPWQMTFFGAGLILVIAKAYQGWRMGIARQMVNVLALVIAYSVGYNGSETFGPLLHQYIDLPERVLAVVGSALVGYVIYVVLSMAGMLIFKKTSQQNEGLLRLGYGVSGAMVGAAYGLFLVWIAILAIRLLGTVAESRIAIAKSARAAAERAAPTPTPAPAPSAPSAVMFGLAHLKQALEQGPAGAVVKQVDPIPGSLYGMLRKLGVMASDDQSVARFLTYPGVKPLLEHPKIAALQNDPEIVEDIQRKDYLGLLQNKKVLSVANDAEIAELMRKFELEKALDYAIRKPEKEPEKAPE